MANLIHNFGARKRKWGTSFKRATDATLEVVDEADHHPTDGGSEEQAIVIIDLLEIGFHSQLASETTLSTDLGEVPLTHEKVWKGIPLEQITNQPNKPMSSRSGLSRPLLPDRLLLNSYIPPQGQAPPIEEVSAWA